MAEVKHAAGQIGEGCSSEPGAAVFVWGAWALALAGTLTLVWHYGSKVPYADDWALTPVVAGKYPVSLAWFWDQHNEHRIPLPKLLLMGLYEVSGYDFRAGMFFNVLVLGALAAAMIAAAKRQRDWTSYADAFLPLALLHWGHYENLLWSFQVQFVTATALAGAFLVLMVWTSTGFTAWTGTLAGLCLVLLPLCGGPGVALVPALSLWLGYSGVRHCRKGAAGDRRIGLVLLAFALGALLLVGVYFVNYQHPPQQGPSAGLLPSLSTSLEFLSMSLVSDVAVLCWPYSGLAVLGLCLVSVGALVLAWRQRPGQRAAVVGLLLFLAATLALGLAVGWGRSSFGPGAGFAARYATLAVLVLCCLFFIWGVYPRSGRFVQMCLLVVMCVPLSQTVQKVLDQARNTHTLAASFEADIIAGVPFSVLLERYPPLWCSDDLGKFWFASGVRLLHRAGIGSYRFLRDDLDIAVLTDRFSPTAATVVARYLSNLPVEQNNLPIKVQPDTEKPCVLMNAEALAAVVPDCRLSLEVLRTAGPKIIPIGELWLRNLALAPAAKAVSEEKLQIVSAGPGRDPYCLYLLGVRKTGGSASGLVVYSKGREPLLEIPLEQAETEQDAPITLAGVNGEDETGVILVNVLGKHQAALPVMDPLTYRQSRASRSTPQPAPEGTLNGADSMTVNGWAWDRNRPNSRVNVDIYDGERRLATVPANVFRQDLRAAGIGDGKHGFAYTIPTRLQDGKVHTIRVKYWRTSVDVSGSPKQLVISRPPPGGT
jgi:hypothetical protein